MSARRDAQLDSSLANMDDVSRDTLEIRVISSSFSSSSPAIRRARCLNPDLFRLGSVSLRDNADVK